MEPCFTVRPAELSDIDQLLCFILELAREEKAEAEVKTDKDQLRKTLFAEDATAHAVICEKDGQPIGHAVYFFNYSTWQGKNGLYVEDLYIRPEFRGKGAGTLIISRLCKIALDADCSRVEWSVLDWNKKAIRFYESLGAEPQTEWVRYRLSGPTLESVAMTKY